MNTQLNFLPEGAFTHPQEDIFPYAAGDGSSSAPGERFKTSMGPFRCTSIAPSSLSDSNRYARVRFFPLSLAAPEAATPIRAGRLGPFL